MHYLYLVVVSQHGDIFKLKGINHAKCDKDFLGDSDITDSTYLYCRLCPYRRLL